MIKKYYKVQITETARNNPKEDIENDHIFNKIEQKCSTLNLVRKFLIDHYGKIPNMKRKIYCDPDGEEIGFIHSFWNKDISHNSKAWWQTDWICITEISEKNILLTQSN